MKATFINYESLSKKIDDYFDTVTDEQLQEDLEKAGYSTYCQIPNFLDGEING